MQIEYRFLHTDIEYQFYLSIKNLGCFFFPCQNYTKSVEINQIQFQGHKQDAKCSVGKTQLQTLDGHFSL